MALWAAFAMLTGFNPPAAAMDLPGFHGGDLAVVGEPFELRLPPGGPFQVTWGDGAAEESGGGVARHVFRKPGVANVTVLRRQGAEWSPVPVDLAAAVAAHRPALFAGGPWTERATLTKVLAGPADSFTVECRVRVDDPATEQVLFASADGGAGACQLGVRHGSLYFDLQGVGRFAAPLGGRLKAGQWHHLAVVYDRAPLYKRSNQVWLYLDGRVLAHGAIDADDPGHVRCGSAEVAGAGFKGQVDALAVYADWLHPVAIAEHARLHGGDHVLRVTVAHPGSKDFAVDAPVVARTIDLPLDPDPRADNGPALRKAVAAAEPGTRLRLVGPGGAGGGTFVVRSLVEANRWAAIPIERKTDFELDGNGATLIFTDKTARYLWVEGCTRTAVRNLTLDLDPAYAPVALYARLLDVDPASRVVRARLVSGRDGTTPVALPRRAKYWRWRHHDSRTLRASRDLALFDSGRYAAPPAADPSGEPGVLRFTLKNDPNDKLWADLKAARAGDNFFLINNADFGSNAVSLTGGSHVTFDRVNYHATLGMVFLAEGTSHLRVTRCRIGPPPGMTAADRPLSAGADGYHFHEMRGPVLFDGNEVALTDDDPISIKDLVWPDVRKIGDRQLTGGKGIKPGSPVELLNPDYSYTNFLATVTAADGPVLTLDRPLPAEVKQGSVLMDRGHHTRDWVLRDNYLHDYYGRVMLYTDHGTVTGNRVHGSLYHVGNSTAYFETAGAGRNIITHRNLFESTSADCAHWGGDRRLPSFHQLTFSANAFLGKGLSLNTAADSLVVRNVFEGAGATVEVKRCSNVSVRDNAGIDASRLRVTESTGTDVAFERPGD